LDAAFFFFAISFMLSLDLCRKKLLLTSLADNYFCKISAVVSIIVLKLNIYNRENKKVGITILKIYFSPACAVKKRFHPCAESGASSKRISLWVRPLSTHKKKLS